MKKTLIVIGIILASLILLIGGFTVVLYQSSVQTYITSIAAKKISEALQSDVSIKHIHYRPLNNLKIDSVYISDQNRDTLVFIGQASLELNLLALFEQKVDIAEVELLDPYINLQTIADSTINCQFILDYFRKDSTTLPFRVNIDQLNLIDTRVRYNEFLVDQINLGLSLPVLSRDSVDITLHQLSLRAQMDKLDATIEANLYGNLDSVFAKNVQIIYHNTQLFAGNLALYSPTSFDSLYVNANCENLYCNYRILRDFLKESKLHQFIKIPSFVGQLGNVYYQGDIKGRLEKMDLHGKFKSQLGNILVNGTFNTDSTFTHNTFCGHLSTSSFHLGKLTNTSDIGTIGLYTHIDLELDSTTLTECHTDLHINHFEYKGYNYQGIQFDGRITSSNLQGHLHINDPNIHLEIDGLADWSTDSTQLNINARLQDFNPGITHIVEEYPNMTISTITDITLFTFGSPQQMLDNLHGYVSLDSLIIKNGERQALMESFRLDIDNDNASNRPTHKMRIKSDYLTANLSGDFQYSTLPQTFQAILGQYMPSVFNTPKKKGRLPNNIDFYAYLRNLNQLTNVFDLNIEFPSYPTIKGFVHEEYNQFALQAVIPKVMTKGTQIEDLTIAVNNQDDILDASVYMYNRLPKHNPTAAKIGDVKANIKLLAENDQMDIAIRLNNTDSVRNEGLIHISTLFSNAANQPFANIEIHPTQIILNDSIWSINKSTLTYNAVDKQLDINNLHLHTEYQSISANGIASHSTQDSVYIELKNIDVQYLLGYTPSSEIISVQGPMSGWASLYSLFSQPMVEANLGINNAGFNGTYIGDVTAEAYLDRETKCIRISGTAVDSTKHTVAVVTGTVIPATKWWGLDIECDSVDVHLIDPWTKNIFSNPQGRAFGNVQVSGQLRKTFVLADLYAKGAQVTIPAIGATLFFNDSIRMDSTAIHLNDVTIYDAEGHTGTLNGFVKHTNFMQFEYELKGYVNKMLAMNIPYNPQTMFSGKVYGTGDVSISGNDTECKIVVNAKTEANSKFYTSVTTATEASSSSFIHFTQPDTTTHHLLQLLEQPKKTEPVPESEAKLILALQIEVTPMTEINLKMGGDDGIVGRGEGNVQINYDTSSEETKMLGTYTLQQGTFAFTLANVVHRNFDIAEGSRVIWTGDPLSPTVDITGRYRTTASLKDLFGSESAQIATNRTSVPVNCVLYMTDLLFNPILKFAVELPQSDESIQSQVNSIINTDEMLMRQVIYLLVFNRFYTAEYLQNTQSVGLNETYSLLSSTVTGQINAWLSKLTDVFTMGFNFRTDGEGETASQEYETNFQLKPVNQLLINGNFGYRYNDLSNRPFFGDLDIEYLLTQNGKLRAKAFTHTVDKYSLRQANTVQGVGIVFKHDFNWGQQNKKRSKTKANKSNAEATESSSTHTSNQNKKNE